MHVQLTKYNQLIPRSFSARQKILRILRNPKVQHCIHDRPPFALILNQTNTVHTLEFYFFKIHLNIFLMPTPKPSKQFLSIKVF
jgi:hypothetical protein